MNINELFEAIQDEFHPDELNGEFLLHGKTIIWSYNLIEDSEEHNYLDEDYDDDLMNYETSSSEELLQEAYQEDYDKLQEFLDSIEETDNWTCSDSEIVDDTIVFKIS